MKELHTFFTKLERYDLKWRVRVRIFNRLNCFENNSLEDRKENGIKGNRGLLLSLDVWKLLEKKFTKFQNLSMGGD